MHLGVQSLVNVPSDATITANSLAPELRTVLAQQFTANGTGTTFVLSAPPISSNSVIVTANGVVQWDYSVSGSTIITNFTPTAGTLIRAAGMGNILTTGTITDDSVSTAKLQTSSVTTAKIAALSVTGDKLTANCVSGNNIVSGVALTGNVSVTGNVTVGSTIGVGNATPSTSGAGITFPATQSASSDANTLDDYEEGTWTPTTSTAGYTISTSSGVYTKIGRLVHCRFNVTFSAVPAANSSLALNNYPFTNSSVATPGSGRDNQSTGAIYVCHIDPSVTTGGLNSYSGVANGSARTFTTSENYIFSLTYQT